MKQADYTTKIKQPNNNKDSNGCLITIHHLLNAHRARERFSTAFALQLSPSPPPLTELHVCTGRTLLPSSDLLRCHWRHREASNKTRFLTLFLKLVSGAPSSSSSLPPPHDRTTPPPPSPTSSPLFAWVGPSPRLDSPPARPTSDTDTTIPAQASAAAASRSIRLLKPSRGELLRS